MTKRDYVMVASTIKRLDIPEDAKRQVAGGLAFTFQQDNPAFKPALFVKACGVEPRG